MTTCLPGKSNEKGPKRCKFAAHAAPERTLFLLVILLVETSLSIQVSSHGSSRRRLHLLEYVCMQLDNVIPASHCELGWLYMSFDILA